MLRGVRVVEGADLERLCGVTHREFESLPLSHTTSTYTLLFHNHYYIALPQMTNFYANLTHFQSLLKISVTT